MEEVKPNQPKPLNRKGRIAIIAGLIMTVIFTYCLILAIRIPGDDPFWRMPYIKPSNPDVYNVCQPGMLCFDMSQALNTVSSPGVQVVAWSLLGTLGTWIAVSHAIPDDDPRKE